MFLLITTGILFSQQVDPRELVRRSIDNGNKSWIALRDYSCLKLDIQKKLDDAGKVVQTDSDLYRVIPLEGARYERLVSRNGQPLDSEEARNQEKKYQEALRKIQNEPPEQKAARLRREMDERSFMNEIPDAFVFSLIGEEELPTGPAWIIGAEPRPGFEPKSRYAKAFSKMSGKLWIDKKDLQWVKADAVAKENVSFGLILARLAKGANIRLEQQRLADGTWVPKGFEAKASARILLFMNRKINEAISYTQYRRNRTVSTADLTAPAK